MSASDNLGQQFGPPAGPHLRYDAASWPTQHAREYGHVQRDQFLGQVSAARAHIDRATAARQAGDLPGAARALKRAAGERHIASRMPN